MAPTVHELQDLFWRAFWTFVSTFLSVMFATGSGVANAVTGDTVEFSGPHLQLSLSTALSATVLNVFLVYARQKAPGTGINAGPPSAPQMPRGDSK